MGSILHQAREGGPGRSRTKGLTNQRLGDLCPVPIQAQPSQSLSRPAQPRRRRSTEFSPTKPRMSRVIKLLDNQIGGRIQVLSHDWRATVLPRQAPTRKWSWHSSKQLHIDHYQPTARINGGTNGECRTRGLGRTSILELIRSGSTPCQDGKVRRLGLNGRQPAS